MAMQAGTRPEAQSIVDGLAELASIGVTWSVMAFPCRDRAQYLENIDWFAREVLPSARSL